MTNETIQKLLSEGILIEANSSNIFGMGYLIYQEPTIEQIPIVNITILVTKKKNMKLMGLLYLFRNI
jgi:hypothetical protein